MITERYNTDTIVWRTQLLCVCRLMSAEQTEVVSNSYTMYYSVISSLRQRLMHTPGKYNIGISIKVIKKIQVTQYNVLIKYVAQPNASFYIFGCEIDST